MTEKRNLRFRCPHCGGKLAGDAELAGALVNCPHCADTTVVPPMPSPGASPSAGARPAIVTVELKLLCAACQGKLRIDARAGGRAIACPECGANLVVPCIPPYLAPWNAAVDAAETADARVNEFSLSAAEIDFLTAPLAADDDTEPDTHHDV